MFQMLYYIISRLQWRVPARRSPKFEIEIWTMASKFEPRQIRAMHKQLFIIFITAIRSHVYCPFSIRRSGCMKTANRIARRGKQISIEVQSFHPSKIYCETLRTLLDVLDNEFQYSCTEMGFEWKWLLSEKMFESFVWKVHFFLEYGVFKKFQNALEVHEICWREIQSTRNILMKEKTLVSPLWSPIIQWHSLSSEHFSPYIWKIRTRNGSITSLTFTQKTNVGKSKIVRRRVKDVFSRDDFSPDNWPIF